MKTKLFTNCLALLAGIVIISSCAKNETLSPTETNSSLGLQKLLNEGYVYTQSNGFSDNQVFTYAILQNGSLESVNQMSTGGSGTGEGLGSQGSVTLNANHSMLYVTNAGDNTLSSFMVNSDGLLTLAGIVSTKGFLPISVTCFGDYVYVLNSGSDNIAGFKADAIGALTFLPGSLQPLSQTGADPAEIKFSPNGKNLIVTEKATNRITIFQVNQQGIAVKSITHASKGKTPFGFEFSNNSVFVVTNAAEGVDNLSSATSYQLTGPQGPGVVSGPVKNQQSASCWIAISQKANKIAYITNTGSDNISSYVVSNMGHLNLLQSVAVSTAAGPIDLVVAGPNDKYVIELSAAAQTIGVFSRNNDGSLTLVDEVTDLPALSFVGLATY